MDKGWTNLNIYPHCRTCSCANPFSPSAIDDRIDPSHICIVCSMPAPWLCCELRYCIACIGKHNEYTHDARDNLTCKDNKYTYPGDHVCPPTDNPYLVCACHGDSYPAKDCAVCGATKTA